MLTESLNQTILGQIVEDKLIWLEQKQAEQPLESFKGSIEPTERSFYQALTGAPSKFILECKKASPSKGLIRPDFDLDMIAGAYANYAAAISVLTDTKYFQGEFSYVTQVREQVKQPVLCKDFFISPYQVYLARYHQADAILLMLSILEDQEYIELRDLAHQLKLGVLTEVSNQQELDRAIALDARVIGINNRNLRDMSITLERTKELSAQIPGDRIVISESGIYHNHQVRDLADFADGFLVGSSLMSEENVEMACRRLILGQHKVCGLTRPEDAAAVYQAGATYGGLIFADKSPRFISLEQAQQVRAAAPLYYVGVFVDAPVEQVSDHVKQLRLSAVQLHGQEDADYINHLRTLLPTGTQVWKAWGVSDQLPDYQSIPADRHLFDSRIGNQTGGTGQSFDWDLLATIEPHQHMLAGGLSPTNVSEAIVAPVSGLDFNSGLESAPGVKDQEKIQAVFTSLRNYGRR